MVVDGGKGSCVAMGGTRPVEVKKRGCAEPNAEDFLFPQERLLW